MNEGEQADPVAERLVRAVEDGDREVTGLARELARYRSLDDAPSWLVLRLESAYQRLRRSDEHRDTLWIGEHVDGVEVQTPHRVVGVSVSTDGTSTLTVRPQGRQ